MVDSIEPIPQMVTAGKAISFNGWPALATDVKMGLFLQSINTWIEAHTLAPYWVDLIHSSAEVDAQGDEGQADDGPQEGGGTAKLLLEDVVDAVHGGHLGVAGERARRRALLDVIRRHVASRAADRAASAGRAILALTNSRLFVPLQRRVTLLQFQKIKNEVLF